MSLLEKIASLTDEQLIESCETLVSTDADDLRFVREAMLMEYESRHGYNQDLFDEKSREFVRDELGRFSSTGGMGMSDALDVYSGGQVSSAPARKISSDSIKSDKMLRGAGVNVARVVEIEEGGTVRKGCFKPDAGENPRVHPAYKGHQSVNEVAASIIDDEMGLEMTAKCERVEIEGMAGSFSEWINDDAQPAKAIIGGEDATEDQFNRGVEQLRKADGIDDMLAYDTLIGNTDRHLDNWMVKDGKVKLIDNGMCMAKNNEYGDERIRFRTMEHDPQFRRIRPLTPKFQKGLDRILENKQSVDAKLKEIGVEDAQRDSFWKRADYMKRAGMMGRYGYSDSGLADLGKLAEGRSIF